MCILSCRIKGLYSSVHLCIVDNARKHKINIRKCDSVSPHLIFCRIGVRCFKPLYNLCIRFRFSLLAECLRMGFKDISPPCNILFGRVFNLQLIAPPVRETLQSCTFGRCKPSDNMPASTPPKGKPPDPSKRLPRVKRLLFCCSIMPPQT